MSEQKDIEGVPGEASPNPDDTNQRPPVGEGPAIAVPETAQPDEGSQLGAGPGS